MLVLVLRRKGLCHLPPPVSGFHRQDLPLSCMYVCVCGGGGVVYWLLFHERMAWLGVESVSCCVFWWGGR